MSLYLRLGALVPRACGCVVMLLFLSAGQWQVQAGNELVNISGALPATDALGRSLPTHDEVGDVNPQKFVGLFYWTWHMNFIEHPPHNVREILSKKPQAIYNYYDPVWPVAIPGQHHYFFWDEPLFGYYRNTDRWVLQKHAEMLADAGVDVIFFDCTNGHSTWKESYMALCDAFMMARKAGTRTPQIAFLLAFGGTEGSLLAMEELYNDLYKPGLYKDLWFFWNGKPLIMAYPETLTPVEGNQTSTTLRREIRDFFTFRPGQPLYDKGPQRPDHWGWLEIAPQHGFFEKADGGFEQVTVGVAQNWNKAQGLTAMNAPETFGRSYTHAHGVMIEPGAVNHGYNFQEQWDRALDIDPDLVFITGWNEWVAHRFKEWNGIKNAFPDQFSQECSRDIEPMKGGHGDNYYYQMVANIRRFKGMAPPPVASEPVTVTIDGNFDEWAEVRPEFKAHRGSTLHRDSPGWKGTYYKNTTGRNDIVLAKAARDDDYVYFYVQTVDALTSSSDAEWMRLIIDADRSKATGWEGYDIRVSGAADGKAVVEKSLQGWKWDAVGHVDYAVGTSGTANMMELRLPRQMLKLSEEATVTDASLDIEFKWSDNMQQQGDIIDFLVNGDVAPAGRFNYWFQVD